ncbi:hypothetical protein E2C01_086110 [Portunus trituberculatus]|uniref:Uncharacterized protein n=1 Tax=Portunus trituberculatus TaxID=210409 RepID=A0A5B7J8T0_PORTR|nr:hypothetical protein [Portunus trituberculatus]
MGMLAKGPPARKPLPRVKKPNLHSYRGQDSNPCAWRSLRPQSTHGSSVPRRYRCGGGGGGDVSSPVNDGVVEGLSQAAPKASVPEGGRISV